MYAPGDPLSCRLAATRDLLDMHPSSYTPQPRWLPSRCLLYTSRCV
ncbi:hypothetical protein [Erwinia amylovora]